MGLLALISGIQCTLFLTMGGTFWSRQPSCEKVHIDGFDPLSTYVDAFASSGGRLLVCSPCHDFYCSIGENTDLLAGAELAGLGHVVDRVMSSSVVTF
jgi:predicted peroxiredoxin